MLTATKILINHLLCEPLCKNQTFYKKLIFYVTIYIAFNPFKAIGGHFDAEKLKKLYVDRVSVINTSNYANGSTNLLSFRENLIHQHCL